MGPPAACVCCGGEEWDVAESEDNPPTPLRGCGRICGCLARFGGLARLPRFVRLLTSLPESPSARARRLPWAECRSWVYRVLWGGGMCGKGVEFRSGRGGTVWRGVHRGVRADPVHDLYASVLEYTNVCNVVSC